MNKIIIAIIGLPGCGKTEVINYLMDKLKCPKVYFGDVVFDVMKEKNLEINEINERNCNFVFEDYYTSVMELLQAICFSKGLNVLKHICLGYYLRDELKREDLYNIFDNIRFKRNSLTYYGSRMDFATAKDAIDKSKILIQQLNSYIK